MSRRVVISGLGPVCGLGVGREAFHDGLRAGRSAIGPVTAFDASGFACQLAAEVRDFAVRDFVPKSYRKATKVMARDIELAVAAADLAARDAGLVTKGTAEDGASPTYPPHRVAAQIGAGLIAADIDEITFAFTKARDEQGRFDLKLWGEAGMSQLTPLWLLKYLPNMLACHVTIIHDTHAPSNTITCSEASSGLSIGEAFRVIQRNHADLAFCGGAESKLNPMAFMRQVISGRLNGQDNENPAGAMRPLCESAAGMVIGEGGAIVMLEAHETWRGRMDRGEAASAGGPGGYAELAGFGASQTVNPAKRNAEPDAEGRAMASAMRSALRDASIEPGDVDLIVPSAFGVPAFDRAELAALQAVFGDAIRRIPIASPKPLTGSCGAGAGAVDVCLAALALSGQELPAAINAADPLPGLNLQNRSTTSANLRTALVFSTSVGGQNAALVLKRLAPDAA